MATRPTAPARLGRGAPTCKTPPLPCVSTVSVAKALPLPFVSVAKTLPLPCVSTVFRGEDSAVALRGPQVRPDEPDALEQHRQDCRAALQRADAPWRRRSEHWRNQHAQGACNLRRVPAFPGLRSHFKHHDGRETENIAGFFSLPG